MNRICHSEVAATTEESQGGEEPRLVGILRPDIIGTQNDKRIRRTQNDEDL